MTLISTTLRSGPPRWLAATPAVHLLGNGRYSVWLSEAGMGRSSWQGSALSRFAADRVSDADGWRMWLRDPAVGRTWGIARPVQGSRNGQVFSAPGVFAWAQRDHGIETRLEVCVAGEADAELRSLTVTNRTERTRTIEVTGCVELVLHDPVTDASHPAFSKLFVQTALDEPTGALMASRRPRGHGESHPAVAHLLVGPGAAEHDTDRARFLGRGRTWSRPAAVTSPRPLSGTVGNVLDPVFASRRTVTLEAGEQCRWTFVLAAGSTPAEALATATRFTADGAIDAAFTEATTLARLHLESLRLSSDEAEHAARLAGALLYGDPRLRAPADVLRQSGDDAPVRAALGIPHLAPLVVLRADEPEALAEFDRLTRQLTWWRAHGIDAHLAVVGRTAPATTVTGVHAADALDPGGRRALEASARVLVSESTLAVLRAPLAEDAPPVREHLTPRLAGVSRKRGPGREREALLEDNGHGGFSPDGREYVVHVDALHRGAHRLPPQPWVNVIANERFGTLVSETGAGFTWSGNSREHRLTPWANDALLDPHGEALYVLDDATGAAWSPTPGPLPHPASYETRHGLGQTRYLLDAEGISHETTIAVDREAPVRFAHVRLTNTTDAPRALTLVSYAQLVLGPAEPWAKRVLTWHDEATGTLRARNATAGAWRDAIAFARVLAPEGSSKSYTTDRESFVGRNGQPNRPLALHEPARFDGVTGPMHDPCFAERVSLTLAPGASEDIVFLLGEAAGPAELETLLARFTTRAIALQAIADAHAAWVELVSRVRIQTPSPELDLMVNVWLPYQTVSCRLWGRSAFYQSGGAFGFRDQLQDALSLLPIAPEMARAQIVRNACQQFVEGDVLHWWHPPLAQGMRTRFADDLLWLPYLAGTYVRATGDYTVLDEVTPFVRARVLEAGEDEAYLRPGPAGESASVYEHAARAIDRSLATGAHGLPLFGCGDWNDGMNRVGREGRGESVWMGWFLYAILGPWVDLAEGRDEPNRATRWRAHRDRLKQALDEQAWDGGWYRRGWYDSGAPLGSKDSDECRIDALAQAWSVLSNAAPRERATTAMAALESQLVSERDGLIRLLTPAFQDTTEDPGYIKGYVAGVRENGGQYTHAALWVVRAFAELGRRDIAARLLAMLSPVHHTKDAKAVRRYKVEPYVIAADVYGVAPHIGRGGWTWYTGSSGWMYRVAIESVLGLRLETGSKLTIKPCIPDEWPGFSVDWQVPGGDGTRVRVQVTNPTGNSAVVVGALYDGREVLIVRGVARVPLLRDGALHTLDVTLGAADDATRTSPA